MLDTQSLLKYQPYPFQVPCIELGIEEPYFALIMDTGTGKTLVAIAVAAYHYRHSGLRRVLVIGTVTATAVWRKEFKKHCKVPYRFVQLTDMKFEEKLARVKGWKDSDKLQVIAINYESVWRYRATKRGRKIKSKDLGEYLRRWVSGKPTMVIADESHHLKNPNSKQARNVARIGSPATHRAILTGTPVETSPLDYYGQYRYLDPSRFGTRHSTFERRYGVKGGYMGKQLVGNVVVPEVDGRKNPDFDPLLSREFFDKIHSIAARVNKREALGLPPVVTEVVPVTLEPKVMRLYHELEEEAIAQLGRGKEVVGLLPVTKLLRLRQITGGFATAESGEVVQVSRAKLNALADLLDDLANEKLVIFAAFLPEIRAIRGLLKSRGERYTWITGAIKGDERTNREAKFNKPSGPRVIVCQQKAGGESLTLTAACYDIFYSVDTSLIKYEQAKGRTDRIGQTRPVTHMHLVAQGTYDEKSRARLEAKQDVSHFSTDEIRRMLKEDVVW